MSEPNMQLNATIDMLRGLLRNWNNSYSDYAKKLGLTSNQLSILDILAEEENGVTQTALCERLLVQKQTINAIITDFWKRGLVKLVEQPEDRRQKVVILTEEGKTLAENVIPRVRNAEDYAKNQLGPERTASLVENMRLFTEACTRYLMDDK